MKSIALAFFFVSFVTPVFGANEDLPNWVGDMIRVTSRIGSLARREGPLPEQISNDLTQLEALINPELLQKVS